MITKLSLLSLCLIFLFFIPVFASSAFLFPHSSLSSNSKPFKSNFELKINNLNGITSYASSDSSFTLYEDAGSSYASGTASFSGSLFRGKVNSLTISFSPTYFDTHTGILGTVYTVIAVGLSSVSASYTEYSQGSSNGVDTASQDASSTTMISIGQSTSITLSNVPIKSNTDSIAISFSITGLLEQELNNDPSNTRNVQASGNSASMNLTTQSEPVLSNTLLFVIGIIIIIVLVIVGIVIYLNYNKRHNNMNNHPPMTSQNYPPQYTNNPPIQPQNIPNVQNYLFCSNCGKTNQKDASFCNSCGQKIIK